MKRRGPSRSLLLFSTLSLVSFAIACGGAKFNDPPGIAVASVAPTSNPLVAQYSVTVALECPGQVMVQFGPDTSYGRNTAWYPTTSNVRQTATILVAGMKASTTYHMRAQAQAFCPGGTATFTGPDTTFATGPLPSSGFPTLTVTRPNPSASSPENPGIELMDLISPGDTLMQAFFTDRDGNPIWYYPLPADSSPETIKFLPNGHLILNIVNGPDSLLREIDLAGNTIREMDISVLAQKMQAAGFNFVPVNLHHDLLPLDNGHLILLANFPKTLTNIVGYPGNVTFIGDGVIDLDENWDPVWAWNSFDYLNPNRHLNGLPDWTHSNALVYSPVDGNLLISMRHQSWILKLEYLNGTGSGSVLWHLGYQGDFALTVDGVPSADPSEWFSYQHFPSIVSQNGALTTLAVWDNGDNRVLNTAGLVCGLGSPDPACFSRATVFQLDESNASALVANLLWADPLSLFGIWGGSINQLGNGNVEFDLNAPAVPPNPGVASQIQEVTQTSTPQVVWQMQIGPVTQNAYRGYRVPSLYPGVTWP